MSMRTLALLTFVCVALASTTPPPLEAQPLPSVGPPFAEVEAMWNAFWTRIVDGDVEGALRYIYSSRRHLARDNPLANLQDLARQMAFCRLEPTPLALGRDEVMYRVQCKYGSETAETLIILRLDFDKVWRFIMP